MNTNTLNDTAGRPEVPEGRTRERTERTERTLAEVAAALQQIAAERHLSRGELADRADIPCRRMGQLWRRANFSMGELWRMSQVLRCSPSDFFKSEASA
jgi:DNA-binding Xre family transcriptional regulator